MKIAIKILLIGLFWFPGFCISAQDNTFLLGQAAFKKMDYQLAINYLNSFLIKNPNHQNARLLIAQSHLITKNYKEALDDLAELKTSQNPEIFLYQARANAGIGNHIQAIEKLSQYQNTNNKISEEIICAYPEFNSLRNSQEWKQLWMNSKYTDKENALNDIKFAIKSGRNEEAADRLDNFLQKYKSNAEAYWLRGNLYFELDFSKSLEYYEIAVALDNAKSEYLISRAEAFHKTKRDKKALEEYNNILKNDSLLIYAYLGRAETQLALLNYQDALNDISKFREYYPNQQDALYIEAQINTKIGDFLNAISEFGKLIKLNPAKPEYFIGRADAYSQTKTYTYAIKDYSMALDLDPKNVEVYKKKAKAHQLAGDLKGACINWDYAVSLGDVESMNFIQKYCKK